MKKIIFILLLGAISTTSSAQNNQASISKNIVSADIGFLGIWINYERQLSGLLTIKTSMGLEGGFGFGSSFNFVAFTPTLRAEPRYYYNFNRRANLEKKTSYNASNYFAVTLLYIPSLFTISNVSGLEFESGLQVIPKFGIKRTIGERVNFEFAIGAGPFINKNGMYGTVRLDIHFGYNF